MEEDKKRTLEESNPLTNGDEEPQKKKPLLNNNHDRRLSTQEPLGPLTVEDIAQFQKEAIFRQMRVYKRERDLLQDKSLALEDRYSCLEKSFILLDEWWNQLIESLFPEASNGSANDEIISLLQLAVDDNNDYKTSLESKNSTIKSRIGAWLKSHPSSSSSEVEIKESLAKVNKTLNKIRVQNQSLSSSNDQLTAQVSDLKEKYLTAEKKLERFESPSLSRVQQSGTTIKREDSADISEINGDKKDTTESTTTDTSTSPEILAEVERLKTALANSEAVATKQTQHIKEFQDQITSLNEQIQSFNARLINLPKSDLEKSDIVRSLWLRNDDLSSSNEKLLAINQKLAEEKSTLQIGQEEFESKLRKEYNEKRENLEQQIAKAEQDVSRIRSARDDLLSELNIKKATESERKKAFEELKSLVTIRESRIKTLEEEIARLKDQSDSTASLTEKSIIEHTNGATSDSGKLDLLTKLSEKLQRQNKSLLAELPGLEQAFAQAHSKATAKIFDAVEQEAIVNKLKAEKTRADEKYFSAMRGKDQLSNENNRLKSQLTKSADLIQQLKDLDSSKTQTITSLRKQLEDVNKSQESLTRDIQAAKQSVTEREYRIHSASRHVEQLKEEIRSKSDAVKKEIDSRHSLEIEIEKLKRQVDAKRLTSVGGSSGAVEEQLDALRSIAICSLCSKNWKDTAIKVCGHVFCNDCAKDRLNARLRKCPMCNKQYSFNDLLPVHL